MKRATYLFACLLACLALACKKEKQEISLSADSFTGCPVGATCNTRFTEQADLSETNTLKRGPYRLFWASQNLPGMTSTLYIKAPMLGTSFELKGDDIRSGRVVLLQSCPACSMVPYKLVDGSVKGVNATPDVAADKSKWLLEARIYMATEGPVMLKDTLYIKQYFYPNFVYN